LLPRQALLGLRTLADLQDADFELWECWHRGGTQA
jgi:hypothetical protein